MDSSEILLEARGITKRFPSVVANDDVSLAIRRGEIHTVLGENGAGKTTLINILSGMPQPDEGALLVRGQQVMIDSPRAALRLKIGTVYQHFTLVPNLSVIENVVLGTESDFVLNLRRAERKLREMLGEFEMSVSPQVQVGHLSIGQQQRVEIIKALAPGSEVLLLDEPTSVLTPLEVEELFQILARLKAEGVALVFITHKLEEALKISDRVTVLRQGRCMGELGPEELGQNRTSTTQKIVDLMFGGLPPRPKMPNSDVAGRTVLALQSVTARCDRETLAVQDVSLELQAGEILGIAGVDGNGQKELGEVIAGQRPVASGQIRLEGVDITNRGAHAALETGIGYVTDDRMGEGCVPSMTVAQNAVLKVLSRPPVSNRLVLNQTAIDAYARRLIEEFDIKTPGPDAPVSTLSGGNIQKLLLARELALEPKVLVCNKPTHGLDLKTAQFVQQTLRTQAAKGAAIVLISSELDEILEVSDRIGVMYNGRMVKIWAREETDAETIGRYMLGIQSDE
ncbi:MAG TPA: ABC transporter ATP-binding protein [Anaerolineae bacterium]|nr:ABC transporter ATP-binding protein [Anaerolineae bacterium]